MKKLLLLAAMAALVVALAVPVTAGAQADGPRGNDISCPEGSGSNAAGTRCIDPTTGEFVEPISQVVGPGEGPQTSLCPESSPGNIWTYDEAADRCVLNGGTLTPTTPTPTTPAPTTTVTPMLPATGGIAAVQIAAMVLVSLAVVGGGVAVYRRR